jgi:hypothetical protein
MHLVPELELLIFCVLTKRKVQSDRERMVASQVRPVQSASSLGP